MENLNNGNRKMWESDRHIVYGTAWKKGETASLVEEAVTHGFRFIDTACQPRHYNEAGMLAKVQSLIFHCHWIYTHCLV